MAHGTIGMLRFIRIGHKHHGNLETAVSIGQRFATLHLAGRTVSPTPSPSLTADGPLHAGLGNRHIGISAGYSSNTGRIAQGIDLAERFDLGGKRGTTVFLHRQRPRGTNGTAREFQKETSRERGGRQRELRTA